MLRPIEYNPARVVRRTLESPVATVARPSVVAGTHLGNCLTPGFHLIRKAVAQGFQLHIKLLGALAAGDYKDKEEKLRGI